MNDGIPRKVLANLNKQQQKELYTTLVKVVLERIKCDLDIIAEHDNDILMQSMVIHDVHEAVTFIMEVYQLCALHNFIPTSDWFDGLSAKAIPGVSRVLSERLNMELNVALAKRNNRKLIVALADNVQDQRIRETLMDIVSMAGNAD